MWIWAKSTLSPDTRTSLEFSPLTQNVRVPCTQNPCLLSDTTVYDSTGGVGGGDGKCGNLLGEETNIRLGHRTNTSSAIYTLST